MKMINEISFEHATSTGVDEYRTANGVFYTGSFYILNFTQIIFTFSQFARSATKHNRVTLCIPYSRKCTFITVFPCSHIGNTNTTDTNSTTESI